MSSPTTPTDAAARAASPLRAWSVTPGHVVLAMLGVALLLGLVAASSNTDPFPESTRQPVEREEIDAGAAGTGELIEAPDSIVEPRTERQPIVLPRWVLVPVIIALGAWGLLILSRQRISLRFRRASKTTVAEPDEPDEEAHAAEIVRVTRDLIEELESIEDPRLAVLHAYASVEAGFGVRHMDRRPAETPQLYMKRIFGQRSSAQEPLSRLTQLFEVARFSKRPMDADMRQGAIDALSQIRDSYRSAETFRR